MKIRTGTTKPKGRTTAGKQGNRKRTATQQASGNLKTGQAAGQILHGGWQHLHTVQKQDLAGGLGGALGNQMIQRWFGGWFATNRLHDRLIEVAEKTKNVQAVIRVIQKASDSEIETLNFSLTLRDELLNNLGIPNMMKVISAITNRQDQIEAAKRKKFMDAIEDTDRYILLANLKAKAWLGSIGNAYYNAWDRHNKILEAQRKDDAKASMGELIGSLILNAALTFVTGGVGGLVAKKMKGIVGKDPDNRQAFYMDGIKDLSKFGVKTVGGAFLKGGKAVEIKPYPEDPFLWKGREEVRINTELAIVAEKMIEWTQKVKAKDPDFDYTFDPVQAVRESLSVEGISVESLKPVDEEQEAKNFEKGFWAAWLERYAYSANLYGATSIEDPILQIPIKKTPISVIVTHCKDLGLDVTPYVEESKRQAKRAVEDAKRMRRGEGMEA